MLSAFLCLVAAPFAQGQMLDNAGDEFIISFLYNIVNGQEQTVELHLTSDTATTVEVEYPYGTPFASAAVSPGAITVVQVPDSSAQGWVEDTVQNNTVHAYSEDEFVCYLVNRRIYTSDAALGLPVDTMNTRYLVMDYFPISAGNGEFVVYASEDDTTVTITPSKALVGHAADVPFDVVLDAGEGYYGLSSSMGVLGSLTGTLIVADKPVGLVNGTTCSFIPTIYGACDHIFEVAQPVQTWGKVILTANLPNHPEGCLYRVLISEDDTNLVRDGGPPMNLNAGDILDTTLAIGTGNHVFSADKPIFVVQFMTGQEAQGTDIGDPAMGNMIPAEQYLSSYTFSTVGGGQFAEHWLTVIAEDADIAAGTILLDSLAIPPASFSPVGTSGFSAALIEISEGTHTTSSDGVHGITVEGFNSYDSYLYPGGAQFEIINPIDLTVDKVYRHTNVCFERDDDMDFLFNEDPVNLIDDDMDGLVDEDDVNCPDGTYMGDLLLHDETLEGDLIPDFYIEALVHKKGWIQNYVPGQYYASSCVKVTAPQDYLKIVEMFTNCAVSGISELNPAPGKGGGSVVIVYIDDMDTEDPADDVAYQIADANPDAGVVEFLYACDALVGAAATLTDVEPGTYCMYVKFAPGLKGETVSLPVSCTNTTYVYTDPEASIYDPEAADASATASLTLMEME